MSRSIFGWDLPAGAANDPNAPWNDEGHHRSCDAHEDSDWVPCCENCDEEQGAGICWLYIFGDRIAKFLAKFQFLHGFFEGKYCVFPEEPTCNCEDFDHDEPDYEPPDDDY